LARTADHAAHLAGYLVHYRSSGHDKTVTLYEDTRLCTAPSRQCG
jgi:hypothetical protein